jgi:protein-tyrosine phosphatase
MDYLKDIFMSNIINLKNTFNFRTIGGYKTIDNKLVKKGILYRSDNLARLNTLDLHYFNILNIERVVDFRSLNEINKEPDILPIDIDYISIPIECDKKITTELNLILNGLLNKNIKEFLIEANKNFVLESTDVFSKFIKDFINSNGQTTLYHCTAGKDRTGFATVIILTILCVPREIIIEEYLFSNYCIERTINQQLVKVCNIMNIEHRDSHKILPLMFVELDYINKAFETIDNKYGNINNYILNGLNISFEEIIKLKKIMLQ